MNNIEINIIAEDIKKCAEYSHNERCLLATAIRRQLKRDDLEVAPFHIYKRDKDGYNTITLFTYEDTTPLHTAYKRRQSNQRFIPFSITLIPVTEIN